MNERNMRNNKPSTFSGRANTQKLVLYEDPPAHIQHGGDLTLRIAFMLVLLLLVVFTGFLMTQTPLFNNQMPDNIGDTIFTYNSQAVAGVSSLSWSPDSSRIASGSSDVRVWDAMTGDHALTLKIAGVQGSIVNAVSWLPDGKTLVTGGSEITLWNTLSAQKELIYKTQAQKSHPQGTLVVNALSWSPDKKTMAVAYTYSYSQSSKKSTSTVNWIDVWKVVTGQHLYTYRGNQSKVLSVAWSPDGKRIASSGTNGTLYVWDATTGKHLVEYATSDSVSSVDWSPSGKYLVSASDTAVKIWDVSIPDKPLSTLTSYSSANALVAWSPDGKYIASADTTIHIWNSTTGAEIFNYTELPAPISSLSWSPNSKYLASGNSPLNSTTGGTGQVKVWYVQ
jgi:WD40 repeat protein